MRPGLVLSLAAASAVAQELRWQLPPRGAAFYDRTLQVDAKVEPAGAWVPPVWPGEADVAAVLQGELDAAGQRSQEPLADLRELLPRLALDLRPAKAGKVRVEFETAGRCLPLRIDATYGAPAPDGTQTIEAVVQFDPKAARVGGAPPPHLPTVQGRLQGTRTVDRARGLVTALRGTTDLVVDFPPHQDGDRSHPARRQTAKFADSWTLREVLAPDAPQWQARIVQGIREATKFLRDKLQQRLGQPFEVAKDPYHDIQAGELALLLLALVRAGEDVRDPILQQGYQTLRERVVEGTYSLGVSILAMEALYTPPGEWTAMREGRLKAPLPRTPTAADKQLLAEWTKALLDNIDSTVDSAYVRRWHYGPSERWDNSNTQYALLGLYGAQLCGIEISPQVWTAAAQHWLQVAVAGQDPVPGEVLNQQDLGKRTRSSYGKVVPKGWGYYADNPTGSMTTAGITGLTLCSAALRLQKKGGQKLLGEIDAAVRGGLVWMQQNLTARRNPGAPGAWNSWLLYYLYGLERACELNQVALLGGRDWYFEGSVQLLLSQRPDGSWGSWVDTALGLLFLKKAALPALTGR